MTATRRDDTFRNFFAVVSATTPPKVAAPPYLDLVVPTQKWRKSRLGFVHIDRRSGGERQSVGEAVEASTRDFDDLVGWG